jgi:uncharacterized protein
VEMMKSFQAIPLRFIIVLVIPIFALLNALGEELVYRGILQEALLQTMHPYAAIILQSTAFAAVHYTTGFPNGILGYGMVMIYGIMLGFLRLRTKGMLAPYLAHLIADLCIGYFLVYNASN